MSLRVLCLCRGGKQPHTSAQQLCLSQARTLPKTLPRPGCPENTRPAVTRDTSSQYTSAASHCHPRGTAGCRRLQTGEFLPLWASTNICFSVRWGEGGRAEESSCWGPRTSTGEECQKNAR